MLELVRVAIARLGGLFRRRSYFDAEANEEFSFHLEMETAENIRRGMNRDEARRAALLRFGGLQRFREETSDARGVVALDNVARDVTFALRRLRRAPAFTAGVVMTLGIAIGAAIGIGTIVYGVLLRNLPYEKPDELMRVGFVTDGIAMQGDRHSPATYFHFAKSAHSFTELGAYWTSDDFNVTDGDVPERVAVALMTPNTLTLLGARPLLGQLFERGDTSWSNAREAILISESLWRRRYGADPSIIGRRIEINRGARTVVGVLPRSFDFPSPRIDIFYPAPVPVMPAQITARGLNVVGRLRKGVDPRAAEAELNALIPSLAARFPAITADVLQRSHAHISVQSLKAATAAPVRMQLTVLGVLIALVLLIATTNVGNLFLLRVERATAEVVIALSLGATRFSIAQRFIVEGTVLGIASTIVALPVAAVALSTKFGFTEREIPRLHEVSFGAMTAMIVFGGAATLGALIGAAAFSRMGIDGQFDRLRAARSTPTAAWRRSQNALVAFQVAIALVLLVATALLGRSFWNLRNADIGFDPTNAMAFQVSLPWNGYTSYAAGAVFHAKLADRLAALPGVTSVAVALRLPLTGRGRSTLDLDLRGANDETRSSVKAVGNMVSADYFRVMKMRLSSGRGFRSGDLRGTPAVIVSERLAKSIFGTTDVVGQTVKELLAGRTPLSFTIIGVVGDVPFDRIEDGYAPTLYFPLQRDGDGVPADSVRVLARPMDVQYVIRGTQFPTASRIEQILKTLDRGIPPTDIRTLTSVVDDATARVRVTMLLIAVAGAAALWLGVIGVYSVVAYAADGRVREFGIRLALGAAPSRIGGIVLRDGLRVVAIGMVAGLIAAFGTTRFLRTLLYEVKPIGVPEFCGAAALLLLVTLLATLIPARRALRTDPSLVLRGE